MKALFSLILSLFVIGAVAEEESVTCKAFNEDINKNSALASEAEFAQDLDFAQLLLIGESHGDSQFQIAGPWIAEILEGGSYDCLFLEVPSDIMTDSTLEFTAEVSTHPFFNKKMASSPRKQNWLNYMQALILKAREKKIKIYHVDFSVAEQKTNDGTVSYINRQNAFIAENIARLFENKSCSKAVAEFGLGHITPTFYKNAMFSKAPTNNLESQPSLSHIKSVSMAFSNILFDYVPEEQRHQCFDSHAGRFIKTERLTNNLPYSQRVGELKDFDYILMPLNLF